MSNGANEQPDNANQIGIRDKINSVQIKQMTSRYFHYEPIADHTAILGYSALLPIALPIYRLTSFLTAAATRLPFRRSLHSTISILPLIHATALFYLSGRGPFVTTQQPSITGATEKKSDCGSPNIRCLRNRQLTFWNHCNWRLASVGQSTAILLLSYCSCS